MEIYVNKNGQQMGPFSMEVVRSLVAGGTVAENDWAWYEGQSDWVPLNQIPGFSAVAPTAMGMPAPIYAPAAGVGQAAPPARRPVLVWIICLLAFIFCPLAMVAIALMPFIMSHTHAVMETAEARLDDQLARTTDPAMRDRITEIQNRLRTTDAGTGHFTGPSYLVPAELITALWLVAAISLFLLRRIAFHLYLAAMIIGSAHQLYLYTLGGVFQSLSANTTALISNLLGVAVGLIINILILVYIWRLRRNGVLR